MKTIVGTWSNPDGTPVSNGSLFLKLNQDSVVTTPPIVPPSNATRIQTTGGSNALKILASLGSGVASTTYFFSILVENLGLTNVTVNGSAGASLPGNVIAPGQTRLVSGTIFETGNNCGVGVPCQVQLQLLTANIGDSLNVVCYEPVITANGGPNLLTGTGLTFGSPWGGFGGAVVTLTQNQPQPNPTILGTSINLSSDGLIRVPLDATGSIPANTEIWANDEITSPSNSSYTLSVLERGGGLVWSGQNAVISNTLGSTITNLALFSDQFDQSSAWGTFVTGGATAPVVTPNFVYAPDDTLTADKIVFPTTAAAATSRIGQDVQVPGGINVGPLFITGSVWLRADSAVALGFSTKRGTVLGGGNIINITVNVGTAWKRFVITGDATSVNTPGVNDVSMFLFQQPSTATQTVYIWRGQIEVSPTASVSIKTTTAPVSIQVPPLNLNRITPAR